MNRRSLLRGAGAAAVGGLPALAGCSLAIGSDPGAPWPTLQYDNRRSGHAPNQTGPSAPAERKWTFQTRGYRGPSSSPSYPVSGPVVGTDAVFVADVYRIYAIERATGEKRWEIQLDVPGDQPCFEGILLLADGLVLAKSCDGLSAYDQQTGDVQWHREEYGGYSDLTVVDGSLYAVTDYYEISEFDFTTGEVRSRQTIDNLSRHFTVTEDAVYAVLWDAPDSNGVIAAFGLDSGEERWRFDPDPRIDGWPTVVGDTVYVGSTFGNSSFYALDAASGDEQWRYDSVAGHHLESSAAVANGMVYLDGDGPTLRAFDATDGTVEWTYDTGEQLVNMPSVAGDTVYFGDGDALVAADAATGEERWRAPGVVGATPAIVDGRVYARTGDGVVALGEA